MSGRSSRSVPVLIAMLALAGCAGGTGSATGSPEPSAAPSAGTVAPPALPITTAQAAMAAVVVAHPDFAAIEPRDPDLIGQSHWWEARPASGVGAFVVTVSVGWGDCQAGCIDTHVWTFAVSPDGHVRLIDETGAAVPPDAIRPPGGLERTAPGIGGQATAGPVCPVERNPPDPACAPRPVAGATIRVSDANGSEVATATTDPEGAFRVSLPPGVYVVTSEPVEGLLGTPAPISATVREAALTIVELSYDTGIR